MRWFGSERVIGFDETAVAGALVVHTPRGARVTAFSRAPLSPGALCPSAFDDNLLRPDEVGEALSVVLRVLGASRPGCLVLPDGVARTVLLEPGAAPPVEYARFRLAPGLPYPEPEAIVDVLPAQGGRFLASAVRRSVVQSYERLAAAAGLARERIDLSHLAALSGLQMRRSSGNGETIDVILGDAALSLLAWRKEGLGAFRARRRDRGPDEADRLAEELDRTAELAGGGTIPNVRIVGTGATGLVRELGFRGRSAALGWQVSHDGLPFEPAEWSWLGGVLE